MTLTLVVPDRPALEPSGGDRYDAAILGQWRHLGREARVVRAAGDWPWPTREQLAELEEQMGSLGSGPVVLDGLVGSSAPELVQRSAAARPTAVLVHSLLSEGAGVTGEVADELDRRESGAVHAAHAVIAVSSWARDRVVTRHGVRDVAVALPGTDPAPVSPGTVERTGTPVLLALGTVAPLKNHAVLLAALGSLAHLPWTLVVAGPVPDPDHLGDLVADATARGVADRITWAGPLVGDPLAAAWSSADLLVHPSRSETYGMVVAEAHAHGIPTVVGAGTGAVEALTGPAAHRQAGGGAGGLPGAAVATDGPAQLAEVLCRWLTEPLLRRRWREAALARRNLLGGWERTVEQIDLALDRITT